VKLNGLELFYLTVFQYLCEYNATFSQACSFDISSISFAFIHMVFYTFAFLYINYILLYSEDLDIEMITYCILCINVYSERIVCVCQSACFISKTTG
jgi:hypothetical protein